MEKTKRTKASGEARIGAITMVRNDNFFLHKWLDYYGKQFGRENLYIYFDGEDQIVPDFCKGANTFVVGKIGDTVRSSDKGRIKFISRQVARLFDEGYDIVVGGDADEYLVVDPREAKSLRDFLEKHRSHTTISGLGLDFGQKLDSEDPLTLDKPFLCQRRYARIGTRYTKASVLYRPAEWGSGFHRVQGKNFHIRKGLYLMHFGYSDLKMIENKLSDSDKLQQGWGRHLKKRKKTINLVNRLRAKEFYRATNLARKLESILRPPYAWNKPALLGMKVVVKLPETFQASGL